MQRIGPVLHVSSSRNIILKAENIPRTGDNVVDENLEPVGKVFDVFGPTSSPYVAVRPDARDPHRFVNRVLYAVPSKPPRERRRKK